MGNQLQFQPKPMDNQHHIQPNPMDILTTSNGLRISNNTHKLRHFNVVIRIPNNPTMGMVLLLIIQPDSNTQVPCRLMDPNNTPASILRTIPANGIKIHSLSLTQVRRQVFRNHPTKRLNYRPA